MATQTFVAPFDDASDALFRSWGSALSAAIKAVGFTQTADTGQPNWATVVRPASGSYVYEFFAFPDAPQSTAPLLVKFGYGMSTTFPALSVALGKGTSGAGALTSPIGTPVTAAGTGAAASVNWYVSSGDGSQLVVACGLSGAGTSANTALLIGVERSRDKAGTATAAGGVWFSRTGGANQLPTGFTLAYLAETATTLVGFPNTPAASVLTALAAGGAAPMFATTLTNSAAALWQSRAVLTYAQTDAATVVPVPVPPFGTYLPLGDSISASSNYTRYAIRWS